MKQWLQRLSGFLSNLAPRERVLVGSAGAVLALALVFLAVIQPIRGAAQRAADRVVAAQHQLEVMQRLQEQFGTAIVLITHDLGVVAETADDVVVMYAGRTMEVAPRRRLFYHPHHPYTEGLLRSLPSRGNPGSRLTPIPGAPPSLIDLPAGCPFRPRCPYAFAACSEDPPARPVLGDPSHRSACWLPDDHDRRGPVPLPAGTALQEAP